MSKLVVQDFIVGRIFVIRGKKVMVDRDLAELYGVSTKRLNEQVKRNKRRFPDDFIFRLDKKEMQELVAICDRFKMLKHSSSLPYVFTEHGVAMLATVLNSEQAVKVSIFIVKVFIKLREMILTHKELMEKFRDLEQKVGRHDEEILAIFEAIRRLMRVEQKPKKAIGFHVK